MSKGSIVKTPLTEAAMDFYQQAGVLLVHHLVFCNDRLLEDVDDRTRELLKELHDAHVALLDKADELNTHVFAQVNPVERVDTAP